MEELFRISVRELVAFSCFDPDIRPTADSEALLTGAEAHRARQSSLEAKTEQTIRHEFVLDGTRVLVYGRMDAFVDGEIPYIEEIKLCRSKPYAVRREHRAQAVCYAAMLCAETNCSSVRFSICYVNEDGMEVASFPETLSAKVLRQEMDKLLLPYIRFAVQEKQHRENRNQSLAILGFPFDQYRKGQRELAAQVYTAVSRKKRLFASLPTGTGKSAAVLYPALKALGNGLTERVIYLTARNTARQSPLNALKRMKEQGMQARISVLTAKEKLCPSLTRCHPDFCPRANGHFIRQPDAVDNLLHSNELIWNEEAICAAADRHQVCPFELALALCEIADVTLMDLNYAFDPFAQVKRLFQRSKAFTLLIDEAHHTLDRVRESLSGVMDSRELVRIRTGYGKRYGRKNSVYRHLSEVISLLRAIETDEPEIELSEPPKELAQTVQKLLDASIACLAEQGEGLQDLIQLCLPYLYAQEHRDEDYAVLLEKHGKERVVTLYCLLPGKTIARITKNLRGTIFFSATLHPLPSMKQLLGGSEEDACFALPSPFPPERLQVVQYSISTRFEHRDQTAVQIAAIIEQMAQNTSGNSIAYFPSYAYLEKVKAHIHTENLPELWVQTRDMTEEDRAGFLAAFDQLNHKRLGLCVLGGLFSEGIDLPGDRLTAAAIVGVGLPVPSARLTAIRNCCQKHFGDGFFYACLVPGMQKVLQAAGRVIRSEKDKGMVILLDDRYARMEYRSLLPAEWAFAQTSVFDTAHKLEAME